MSESTSALLSGVYLIRNVRTSDVYVGSSTNLTRRWATHQAKLRDNRHHCRPLQLAWNQYGHSAFEFVVAQHCPPEWLAVYEQLTFSKHQGGLYNTLRKVGRTGAVQQKQAFLDVATRKIETEALAGVTTAQVRVWRFQAAASALCGVAGVGLALAGAGGLPLAVAGGLGTYWAWAHSPVRKAQQRAGLRVEALRQNLALY